MTTETIRGRGRPNKQAKCASWLRVLVMKGGGRALRGDIMRGAVEMGFCDTVVRHAKATLGLEAIRIGFAENSKWYWGFPSAEPRVDHGEVPTKIDSEPDDIPGNFGEPEDTELVIATEDRKKFQKALEKRIWADEKRNDKVARLFGGVLSSDDPHALIQEAGRGELILMIELVQKYCHGQPKYKEVWEVTESIEVPAMERSWSGTNENGHWVDTPTVSVETRKRFSDVPVDGATKVSVPTGTYDPPADASKWKTWLAVAEWRLKNLDLEPV
jgi:hypothetical protein